MSGASDVRSGGDVAMHGMGSDGFFDMSAGSAALDAMLRGMDTSAQRSEAWFRARRETCITGSALSNLLFFDDEAEMLEWREQLLGIKPKKKFDASVLEKMAFGRKHEDTATQALMQHLRGSGIRGFWDAGFCRHHRVPIGASPDGVLWWPGSRPGHPSQSEVGALEIKVSCSEKPYSAVPYYYVPQVRAASPFFALPQERNYVLR